MHLYSLMRFPDTVRLENQSVLSGEEVFLRGLFELASGHKRRLLRRFLVAIPAINLEHSNIL